MSCEIIPAKVHTRLTYVIRENLRFTFKINRINNLKKRERKFFEIDLHSKKKRGKKASFN